MNAYERRRRTTSYRRMVRQLNAGVLPSRIRGDRDVLRAAMDAVQREVDRQDDGPRRRW